MTTRRRNYDLVRRITRKIIAQNYTFGNDPDRQWKDRYQRVGFDAVQPEIQWHVDVDSAPVHHHREFSQ